jgi:hypothetical protein
MKNSSRSAKPESRVWEGVRLAEMVAVVEELGDGRGERVAVGVIERVPDGVCEADCEADWDAVAEVVGNCDGDIEALCELVSDGDGERV